MFKGRKGIIIQKKPLGRLWKYALTLTLIVFGGCLVLAGRKTYTVDQEFADFLEMYEKPYTPGSEFVYRQSLFQANRARIEAFNTQHEAFSLRVNQFSDRTEEEMRLPILPVEEREGDVWEIHRKGVKAVPTEIDWTTKGVVTVVKNERNCKSSWIFASIAAAESLYAIQNIEAKVLLEFSEQAVIDCSGLNAIFCVMEGPPADAFQAMKQMGLVLEAQYPYEAQQSLCGEPKPFAEIGGSAAIPSGNYDDIIAQLVENPLVVSVDAGSFEFLHYGSGIFTSTTCSETTVNHSMLLVGFNMTSNPPYYKVKNSWGPTWGENGYMRIAMTATNGPGTCGIQSQVLTPLRAT